MDPMDYDNKDDKPKSKKAKATLEMESVVAAELRDATDYIDHTVSPQRAKLTEYYLGKPFGNEVKGKSGYVSTDVRDTVLGIMPPLMRIFAGVERVCEFAPTGPEDVAAASQATDVMHEVFYKQNNGFHILYSAFKDALVRKTGVLKWWYEEDEEATTYHYSGKTEDELRLVLQTEGSELVEQEVVIDAELGVPVFDAEVRITRKNRRYCVAAVPPEEFLIDRKARSIEEAQFVAHRCLKTVSDLVAMGYDRDEVLEHAGSGDDDDLKYNEERFARNPQNDIEMDARSDESARKVWYYESYLKYDLDGDGVAELIKCCSIGSAYKVMAFEGVDEVPFAILTPDPEPHTWLGLSEGDKVMDIQNIKSDVTRNIMDSLAQSIHPRTAYVQGAVSVEDLQSVKVGGLVRMRAPGMVQPLETPFVGQQAFPLIEYLDAVREQRTGVSRAAQGLAADAMQSTTRAAVNATVEAAKGRVELIARVFAETGLARMFKGLLKLMVLHEDKPMVMRLRNQFVQVDPRVWNTGMDVEINCGMSASTTDEKAQILSNIAQKQEQILQMMGPNNPMVSLVQYRTTLAKMVELTGYRDASMFFNDLPPDFQMPPPPPMQDPQAQATELLAQVEREKAMAKMQIDQAKLEADMQVKAAKLQLDREQMQADMARKQLELEMQAQKMEAELRMKEAEMVLKQLTQLQSSGQNDMSAMGAADQQAQAESRQEGMLSQAIMALGQMIQATQAQTAAAMAAPKRIIRNEDGSLAGVETGDPLA
jgi:hypothetical protein